MCVVMVIAHCGILYVCRLRIAAGYDEPGSGLYFALWFFHAFCLPLPGEATASIMPVIAT